MKRAWLILLAAGLQGCARGPEVPAAIDTSHDACAHCRMIVSDPRVAAQIVAPGDEPLIFDDIGCLRDYLATHAPADDAVTFVADHRTGAWLPAADAVYTRVPDRRTPMGSGILAHADGASRDRDPATARGVAVDAGELLAGTNRHGDSR